jgi:predicted DNA-binding transcriptional regulator YafY
LPLKYCFGITIPEDETPSEIRLSFEPFQRKYIKSLPLHFLQKILIDSDEELRISLQFYLTPDFIMELLSLGDTVKVIEPQELVSEMKERFERALENYL